MSSEVIFEVDKESLDEYLSELSKEYKKVAGRKLPAEVIIVGGAAIIEQYGFRDMTTDIDAIIDSASVMKEAVNRVSDKYDLPYGWINMDFMKTGSFSCKLRQYSRYYKTFNQVMAVRIVTGEYLIAMKLMSGRQYKNDLSDIVGILDAHQKRGDDITFDRISKAVCDLYGSWDEIPERSKSFLDDVMRNGNYQDLYDSVRRSEIETKELIVEYDENNPGVITGKNLNDLIDKLREIKDREGIER